MLDNVLLIQKLEKSVDLLVPTILLVHPITVVATTLGSIIIAARDNGFLTTPLIRAIDNGFIIDD